MFDPVGNGLDDLPLLEIGLGGPCGVNLSKALEGMSFIIIALSTEHVSEICVASGVHVLCGCLGFVVIALTLLVFIVLEDPEIIYIFSVV